MPKSIVSMEQHCCMVCGNTFDTGSILLQTKNINFPRLRDRTVTDYGLCDKCQQLHDDGYIALIAIDESKSKPKNGTVKPEDAYRTGEVAHLRRTAAKHLFDLDALGVDIKQPFMFCDSETIQFLKEKINPRNFNETDN